jgi:ABC-type sulfate/molybdate transport systems ATPase subunit
MLEVALRTRLGDFQLEAAFAAPGGLVTLFGPSGSGKSLTLQTIAGTIRPDAGRISLDGQLIFDSSSGLDLPAQNRRVGYVPQHYALFPHLNVADNIGFGLARLSNRTRRQRVSELLGNFHLEALAERRPRQLSGGQQQRVALARALAVQPRLLLLDEPFAALDAALRGALREELAQVQRLWNLSMLIVTHDLSDVFALGQRVIVYDNGRVIQQGTRDEVFFRPGNRRVAEFVQMGNILPAVVERVDGETLWLRWRGHLLATDTQPLAAGTPVYVCIRPTQILIVRPDRSAARERQNVLSGTVVHTDMQAETYTLHLRLDDSEAAYDLEIVLPGYVYHRLAVQTTPNLVVELNPQHLHVIPRA